MALRGHLYASGRLKADRLSRPVISIGNLTMGGTGKTPAVIAIGRMLEEQGLRLSILLRGYKGSHATDFLLVSDGDRRLAGVESAGDEALLLAANLPRAVVAVGRRRAIAGHNVEQRFPVDVHLLDDGFQHLQLQRNFNLVLVDTTNPWGGGLPPWGRLREPTRSIRRADAVLLTRVKPGENYQPILDELRRYKPSLPVFRARQTLAEAVGVDRGEQKVLPGLGGKPLLAFAGIGNPRQFFDSLEDWGAQVAHTIPFRDHHRYTAADIENIKAQCLALGLDSVATTEKDAGRFSQSALEPLRVIVVKMKFEIEERAPLLELLLHALGTHRK